MDDWITGWFLFQTEAPWIKNWIEGAFAEAVSILDYYHAWQHLHEVKGSLDQKMVKTDFKAAA
jgi:hypothetical protein